MIDRAELRVAFEAEKPALLAWGLFVTESVVHQLQDRLPERQIKDFLKIWPEPRVKETESFLAKTVRPGKNYKDPLKEITDKVGVRFVTLLLHEIRIVEKVITESDHWSHEKARDFEQEKAKLPLYFDYQSVHYVVRAKEDMTLSNNTTILAGMACEVQIRTLLQHAYSELAHDATYKPKTASDPRLTRNVAKSMALIEVTDEIFETVKEQLIRAGARISAALQKLTVIYRTFVMDNSPVDVRLSQAILDAYTDFLPTLEADGPLDSFFTGREFIFDRIRERAAVSELFAQPVIIAVYFLVFNEPEETWKRWSLDLALLEPVFTDLGISTADF